MKHAYAVNPNLPSDRNIVLTKGKHVLFWKELSQEDHDKYADALLKNNQIVYEDTNGNLQIRDRETIWDESTNLWIPDLKAIRDKANNDIIAQAVQAYHSGNLDRHQFSKLSKEQQLELSKYLDDLLEIINIKESRDYDITLPLKPEFLA